MFLTLSILAVLFAVWLIDLLVFQLQGKGRSSYRPEDLLKGYRCKQLDCSRKDPSLLSPTDPKIQAIPGNGPKTCPRCSRGILESVNRPIKRWESVRMALGGVRLLVALAVAMAGTAGAVGWRRHLGDPVISFPSSLDFGVVPIGMEVSRDFPVKNLGTGALDVSPKANQEVRVEPRNARIPQGGQVMFRVTYSPPAAASLSSQLLFTSNTTQPPRSDGVKLTAEAVDHGVWWVFDELQKTSKITQKTTTVSPPHPP